jgi:S1-C subfamily serine protease
MNRLVAIAFGFVFALGTARAEDEPKGAIGVQLKVDDGKIVVVQAVKDRPAEKAGIKEGDVIVKIDDHAVKEGAEQEDLQALVKEVIRHNPGDKIKVVLKRDGKEMTLEVTVGEPIPFPKKDE